MSGSDGAAGETPPRVAVVDNHDSFTFNVVHALEIAGARCRVFDTDTTTVANVLATHPQGIVVSPGPCTPDEAGISIPLVREVMARCYPPLLGVCLGHQAIARAFGARLVRARRAWHGKLTRIDHDGEGIFEGLARPLDAVRYNSLVVDEATLPAELAVAARDEDGDVMALRALLAPLDGVQFHPEAWLGPGARPILDQWVAGLPRVG